MAQRPDPLARSPEERAEDRRHALRERAIEAGAILPGRKRPRSTADVDASKQIKTLHRQHREAFKRFAVLPFSERSALRQDALRRAGFGDRLTGRPSKRIRYHVALVALVEDHVAAGRSA